MQKFTVIAGATAIGALILGSLAAITLRPAPETFAECRGSMVIGGQIGGPFTLLNGDGKAVTDADVLNRPALVYFGYTFCPDVCPLDNSRNAAVADALAEAGLEVTPIFISVDPKRDTPEIMRDYVANLSPRMIGLTGTEEQVRAVALAYKVFYNVPMPDDPYYKVDHTTFTYLMLPGVGFIDVFDRDATEEEMVKRVSCYLDKAKS